MKSFARITFNQVSIANPVLTGFHPDPSSIRVGDDFFLATSTFEWFPGICLHHSRDLVHWRAIGHALTRPTQLDLRGVPDSGGIWAPSLSFDGERFHLVYSLVNARRQFPLVSVANYLVSSWKISGPWSEPQFLNGSGWDPFLFHDPDGHPWLLNAVLDQRPGETAMKGIVIQELSLTTGRLVGVPQRIFEGTSLGCSEGPQLFVRQGWHYLVTAEGGTSWGHAVTVARSRDLLGPYLPDPAGPLLTSRDGPDLPLQNAGHGSLVTTKHDEWYMAHLCSRPLSSFARGSGLPRSEGPSTTPAQSLARRTGSPLGRETAIQKIRWTASGWPRLHHDGHHPRVVVPAPDLPPQSWAPAPERDDFEGDQLSTEWMTLRAPPDESWCSLRKRPGHLTLRGREPLFSQHEQSLVARRLMHHRAIAETVVAFEPETSRQAAGLLCFHDTRDFVYLAITFDERIGKHLAIVHMSEGRLREQRLRVSLPREVPCFLRAEVDGRALRLSWSDNGADWHWIGEDFAMEQLADDHEGKDSFTGTVVGLCAQDLDDRQRCAEFDYFNYRGV